MEEQAFSPWTDLTPSSQIGNSRAVLPPLGIFGVGNLLPEQSLEVVEHEGVVHFHLAGQAAEGHARSELLLQLFLQLQGSPVEQIVLQQLAHLGQVGLHHVPLALLQQFVTRGRAVPPEGAVPVLLTVPALQEPSDCHLRRHLPQLDHLEVELVVVAHVAEAALADVEAPVGAVEDFLHEFQEADGDFGSPGPGWGKPLVDELLGDGRQQGLHERGHIQPVQGRVGDLLGDVQVPTVPQQLGRVLLFMQGEHEQEFVELKQRPDGFGLCQGNLPVMVHVCHGDDPAHQGWERWLIPQLGLKQDKKWYQTPHSSPRLGVTSQNRAGDRRKW